MLDRMLCSLARRGPDSEGVDSWDDERVMLGHRRLAIFDLSEAGHQPMLSDDRAIGIVFNGAIYNFRELRQELMRDGFAFRSETDTEVLVQGYRRWGMDELVARIRGMFAFALWDDARQKFFLVRDRLGVKPLIYVERDGVIAFASTVRALREAGLAGSIDAQAMAEFLEFGFVTDERAIYEGIRKVPAATIIEWSSAGRTQREYWRPPAAGSARGLSFDDAVNETERLLLAATERRLFADVPVGSLLSGGIDSGLVCWAIAKLGGDITAFTVGTPGDPTDESDDARATARELGIRHELLDMSGAAPADVHEVACAYGEPFGAPSSLGMLRVSQAIASTQCKVLLTGDGGDDVFLGYQRHLNLLKAQRLARWVPEFVSTRGMRDGFPRRGRFQRALHFAGYATGGLGAFLAANDGLPTYRRLGLLGPRLSAATVAQRSMPWSVQGGRRVLEDYLDFDRRTQFVAEYLTKVDGATMRHALEARSPFFDQELYEFAASLPVELRLHDGQLKSILRELARRRIGERIATGRKRGFSIPVGRWIADRWRDAMRDRFTDSVLARDGWVDAANVLRVLDTIPRGGEAPIQLWYLLVLEEWMRVERQASAAQLSRSIRGNATARA